MQKLIMLYFSSFIYLKISYLTLEYSFLRSI